MVKIITGSGEEEKFDSKDVEKDLEAAGLPERVAEEVAERVEDRVEDRWTIEKVRQQIDLELSRLEEDIQRAHRSFKGESLTKETGRAQERTTGKYTSETTFVPETERERHERRY